MYKKFEISELTELEVANLQPAITHKGYLYVPTYIVEFAVAEFNMKVKPQDADYYVVEFLEEWTQETEDILCDIQVETLSQVYLVNNKLVVPEQWLSTVQAFLVNKTYVASSHNTCNKIVSAANGKMYEVYMYFTSETDKWVIYAEADDKFTVFWWLGSEEPSSETLIERLTNIDIWH